MDPKLFDAASSGDVSFLKEAIASQPPDDYSYFLSQPYSKNIFHLAAGAGQVEFFKEAMERLPTELILVLLSQQDNKGRNPIRVAVWRQRSEIVRLILGFYKSYTPPPSANNDDLHRPWSALLYGSKSTLLHRVLESISDEESALEILSMDKEMLCTMVDDSGNSPLFLAVAKGYNQVAEKILTMSSSFYSLSGANGSTALHIAPYSSDVVLRLLLAEHQHLFDEVDDDGYSVLHTWAEIGEAWPLNIILEEEFTAARSKIFRDSYTTEEENGDSPLHIAARQQSEEFVRLLVQGIQREMNAAPTSELPDCSPSPWKIQNNLGNTPLHTAIENKNQAHALQFLSADPTLCYIINNQGESPLFIALKMASNFDKLIREILKTMHDDLPSSTLHRRHDGVTLLHLLPGCPDDSVKLLMVKHQDLIDVVDDEGYSALHRWAYKGDVRPLNLLLEEEELTAARTKVFRELITSTIEKDDGDSPLHTAAREKSEDFVRVLVQGIQREMNAAPTSELPDCSPSPWKIQNNLGNTPLHTAIKNKNQAHALQFLSADPTLCYIINNEGKSPLFIALEMASNFDQLIREILKTMHDLPSGTLHRRHDGVTLLHLLPGCPDDIVKLLMAKHQDLIDVVDCWGKNALHSWAYMEDVRPLKFLLEEEELTAARTKVFRDLITYTTHEEFRRRSPLHIAAGGKSEEFVRVLVQGIQQEMRAATTSELPADCSPSPWKIQDYYGNTPLHTAIEKKNQAHALQFLSVDPTSCHIINNNGQSPLFIALEMTSDLVNFDQVIEEILKMNYLPFSTLHRSHDGVTLLHLLPRCPGEIGKRLVEKFWWMMELRDKKGRTALDNAREENIPWLVNLLTNPFLIKKEPFNWMKACERSEETPALFAFIDTCYDLQAVCREQNDTPLHHIKFETCEDYANLFNFPSIKKMKNVIDYEGATPLHRALQRKNIDLAKILLKDNGVERIIEDDSGTTAMELLAKLVKEDDEWAKMCREIKVYPFLRTMYLKPGTDLDKIRNTLSVVAALLATITFAAGFTLPGGLNQKTGDAILAKRVAFLIFLLSDAYAMCTSMLVLFFLVWSMVSARDMSNFLVDRSVLILMHALYGTMVAFMTGIYAVIKHSSRWAAIIIFFMCFVVGIFANRTFLFNVYARFSHIIYRDRSKKERRDPTRLPEEGNEEHVELITLGESSNLQQV